MQAFYGPTSGLHMRNQDMLLDWLFEDRATDRLANAKSQHPQGQQQHQSCNNICTGNQLPHILDLRACKAERQL